MKIYRRDWEYNSSEDINALKELMTENMQYQDDSEVGIFWYDPENDELFGIKSADVNDVPFYPIKPTFWSNCTSIRLLFNIHQDVAAMPV